MENLEWKHILKQHPIFSALTKEEIERLVRVSTARSYSPGQTIIQAGEEGRSAYLVGAGAVDVVLPWKGGEQVTVSTLRKNDFFGEMAVIEEKPRAATVRASEPCSLLEIPKADFLKLLNEHADIELKVAASLSSRLRHIGEEVLKRQKELHEDIQSLDGRLNAELKVMDAALKASETIFDQTNKRANEIIESAERARTRLTTVASAVGTIVGIAMALFAWFGINELVDIRKERKEIFEVAGEARTLASNAKTDLKNIDQTLKQFNALRKDFYRQIMIPAFQNAMEKDPKKAPRYYKAILEAGDPFITDSLFASFFAVDIFYTGGDFRKRSREMLQSGFKYVTTPRQKILSYYLILSALVLENKHHEFEETFRTFEEYVKTETLASVKNNLTGDFGRENLDGILSGEQHAERKKKDINKVWKLIP